MTVAIRQPRKRADGNGRSRARMTYREFLAHDFPHPHFEWVDGRAIEMPAVEDVDNQLVVWLSLLLGNYFEETGAGQLRLEPFQMRLQKARSGRAPDIQVILKANLNRVTRVYTDGPADLVIEVTSAGSRTTDRRDKFKEYEKGGVREYWILDPLRKHAEFFHLIDGTFVPAELTDDDRYVSLVLPKLWINVSWLWSSPRPTVKSILARWGLK